MKTIGKGWVKPIIYEKELVDSINFKNNFVDKDGNEYTYITKYDKQFSKKEFIKIIVMRNVITKQLKEFKPSTIINQMSEVK